MSEQEEPARPLTAEERRQRRLAKILGNPEGRINRILNNGSDSNGPRHAPAIEGGEGYNILPSPTSSTDSNEIVSEVNPLSGFPGFPAEFAQFAGNGTPIVPVVPPKSWVNVTLVALMLGLLSRAIMLWSGPINIGVLWALFYVSFVSRFSSAGYNNKTRNELAAVFQAMGNGNGFEKIMNAGFKLVEFIQTTVTFSASFLLAHMLLEVYDFSGNINFVY